MRLPRHQARGFGGGRRRRARHHRQKCAPRGDAALAEYSQKFDGFDLAAAGLAVSRADIETAYGMADKQSVEALRFARERIVAHHQRQRPADDRYVDPIGVELGSRWTAIEAVGLYVPGGTASYPSWCERNGPRPLTRTDPLDPILADVREQVLAAESHPAWEVLDRDRCEALLSRPAAALDEMSRYHVWRLATVFVGNRPLR